MHSQVREKLQRNVTTNRDRIRGQLKGKLFLQPFAQPRFHEQNELLPQQIPNSINVSMELKQSPTKGLSLFIDEGQAFSDCYEIGKTLGQGAHAIVKMAYKKHDTKKELFAVKIFRTSDPEIISTIRKTYQIGRMLQHPQIVSMRELFINENNGYSHLVMDYHALPDLLSEIHLFVKQENLAKEMMKSLLTTVAYMHRYGVCHRDLKPDNILVYMEKSQGQITLKRVIIIDLGVSKKFLVTLPGAKKPKQMEMWTSTGTQVYCAPEIFQGGGYSQKVDVWAIGIILFQCLTGCLPFLHETVSGTIDLIQKGIIDYNHPSCANLSKPAKDLINRLVQVDPKKRLHAKDAFQHPWLKSDQDQKMNAQQSKDDLNVHDGLASNSSIIILDLTQSQNPHISTKQQQQQQQQHLQPKIRNFSVEDFKPDIHLTKQEKKEPFRLNLESASRYGTNKGLKE